MPSSHLVVLVGVQRGLVGEIISRFERKGFKLRGLKLFQCTQEIAEQHYKDLKSKPFFPALVEYILSGPVVCMASLSVLGTGSNPILGAEFYLSI